MPIALVLSLWVGAGIPASVTAGQVGAAEIRNALASHRLADLSGTDLDAADLEGEIVVVNFWATWCEPCRREMPLLQGLHDRLAARGGRVMAISVDRSSQRVTDFVEELGLSLPVYTDGPDGLAKKLDLEFLPYTVVLDREGQVVFAGAGGPGKAWDGMERVVEKLLDASPLSAHSRKGTVGQ